ncbi:MAG: hypothetical protein FWB91_07250 [Defluviitaleaceae bacterium]|nr:hypothetical protein [Defluviitaleaceae bacterium]
MNNSNSPKNEERAEIRVSEIGLREAPPKVGKVSVLWLILNLIFLFIFNVFFFLLGERPHYMSVWMSYVFIHFAYFMLIATPILTRKGKNSKLFGPALYSISAAYFFVAFVAGVVFVLIASDSYTTALLVQLSIAGIYGVILIFHMIANEHTADAEEQRQYQVDYVKNATFHLKRILDKVKDKEAKKKVEKAFDAVNSSPVKSHPNVGQIERRILTLIDELDDAVSESDKQTLIAKADYLLTAVNDRNSHLKNLAK